MNLQSTPQIAIPVNLQVFISPDENVKRVLIPRRKITFRLYDWVKIPYSLFFLGMAGILFYAIIQTVNPFIIAFFIAGTFYAVIGRFLWNFFLISNSIYVITDRKLLFHNKFFKTTKVLSYTDFNKITRDANRNDFGCLIFGTPIPLFASRGGIIYGEDEFVFESIDHTREVYAYITDVMEEYNKKWMK